MMAFQPDDDYQDSTTESSINDLEQLCAFPAHYRSGSHDSNSADSNEMVDTPKLETLRLWFSPPLNRNGNENEELLNEDMPSVNIDDINQQPLSPLADLREDFNALELETEDNGIDIQNHRDVEMEEDIPNATSTTPYVIELDN